MSRKPAGRSSGSSRSPRSKGRGKGSRRSTPARKKPTAKNPKRKRPVKTTASRKTSKKKAPRAPTRRAAARPAAKKKPVRPAASARPAAPRKVKGVFNAGELAKFREHLLSLRSNRIGDKESREKEALKAANQDVSVDHMADFGSDNYEQEFTLGLIEQDVETLRAIEDALVRIGEGTFGLCEECGKKITKARLRVLPHARLCVECKIKEE